MIMQEALPSVQRFLQPAKLSPAAITLTIRCLAAFCLHFGRMSAAQAAQTVQSQPCHRAQITRFLSRREMRRLGILRSAWTLLLACERQKGRFLLILDQTLCSQQGNKTANTFSTGNRQRRPRKGRRYSKYTHKSKRCHCFVMGLVITPSGLRLPLRRFYYTKEYCAQKGITYRKQTELAAEMIRELTLPQGTDVMVLGDTAFDAKVIRQACDQRNYLWIVPLNPERVLAGAKPRPKVKSLSKELTARQFQAIRLCPSQGKYVAQRRLSAYRIGPKVKSRIYYAHRESREVHSVGEVLLVFSTREKPIAGEQVNVQKILMTNALKLTTREVVELYDLRWQIELFFKEMKSTLGLDQYRFRRFEQVEGWVDMALTTFMYLEWYRARQMRRRDVSAKEKERWRCQRTHGLCVAIRQETERADLDCIVKATKTKGGLRRLRRLINKAIQKEYRVAA